MGRALRCLARQPRCHPDNSKRAALNEQRWKQPETMSPVVSRPTTKDPPRVVSSPFSWVCRLPFALSAVSSVSGRKRRTIMQTSLDTSRKVVRATRNGCPVRESSDSGQIDRTYEETIGGIADPARETRSIYHPLERLLAIARIPGRSISSTDRGFPPRTCLRV